MVNENYSFIYAFFILTYDYFSPAGNQAQVSCVKSKYIYHGLSHLTLLLYQLLLLFGYLQQSNGLQASLYVCMHFPSNPIILIVKSSKSEFSDFVP